MLPMVELHISYAYHLYYRYILPILRASYNINKGDNV